MDINACCFIGHRHLPVQKVQEIFVNLDQEIERCMLRGLGFDQLAASLIIAKKELGEKIQLVFALPYKNHHKLWNAEEKALYRSLLKEADDIVYVSEEYNSSCIRKWNYYMVEHSTYCICALLDEKSGIAKTVRYAREKGLTVMNIAN